MANLFTMQEHLETILIDGLATISDGNYRLSYSVRRLFKIQKRINQCRWERIFDTPGLLIAIEKYAELVGDK